MDAAGSADLSDQLRPSGLTRPGQIFRDLPDVLVKLMPWNPLHPPTLKTILHSKRANLYYLEHCRVLVKGGRVEYVTDTGKRSLYWNIPIASTTSILLGTGTSITQAAMRELAKAGGILVGFAGWGRYATIQRQRDGIGVAWFAPVGIPAHWYLQAWVRFWFDDDLRLMAAKALQTAACGACGNNGSNAPCGRSVLRWTLGDWRHSGSSSDNGATAPM